MKRRFHVTIPLKKLTTSHQKISMPYGTFRTLSVNFKPWNASDKKLTWSTNNDTVAVVDENGHVTTRGVGVAVITATSIKIQAESAISRSLSLLKMVYYLLKIWMILT